MSESTAITVRDLGKRYRVWTHSRPTSLSERAEHLLQRFGLALGARRERPPHREEIWALRGVSFDVHRGEVLGVIGPNGAGKSTLLSILARITEPTEGRAEIEGRVSSILEVGTGFHPELSGRDNVFLNGAVLGMSREETAAKFDEIVAFSGVSEFIDMPVKRYSSGMYLRLAFSVAAHLDPDVLLLDEVLAVGDRAFQEKCLRRVQEIVDSGRTVLFVSHDVASVARLCKRAVVVNEGHVVFSGPVHDAIDHYLGARSLDGSVGARQGSGEARIASVRARGADSGDRIFTGSPLVVEVEIHVLRPIAAPHIDLVLAISHPAGGQYVDLATQVETPRSLSPDPIVTRAECHVDGLPLRPGAWMLSASLSRTGELIDPGPGPRELRLLPSDFQGSGELVSEQTPAPVLVRHRWDVATKSAAGAPLGSAAMSPEAVQ